MVRTITNGKNPGEFRDDEFILRDNTTPTKKAKFECSGITAATTRTITLPDVNGTLMTTASATVDDSIFRVTGSSDATKILAFEVDGFTTATTRTITVPDVSFTLLYETTTTTTTTWNVTSGTNTMDIKYVKKGTTVVASFPRMSATPGGSAVISCAAASIPSGYRPNMSGGVTRIDYPVRAVSNSVVVTGLLTVNNDGSMSIAASLAGGAFTSPYDVGLYEITWQTA